MIVWAAAERASFVRIDARTRASLADHFVTHRRARPARASRPGAAPHGLVDLLPALVERLRARFEAIALAVAVGRIAGLPRRLFWRSARTEQGGCANCDAREGVLHAARASGPVARARARRA